MSRQLKYVLFALGPVIIAVATWSLHARRVQAPTPIVKATFTNRAQSTFISRAVPIGQPSKLIAIIDPRTERKNAKDYWQLMNRLLPLARAGSAPAQYALARALHYCNSNLRAHFISPITGAVRTPAELRALDAHLDENTLQFLDKVHQRCQAFLSDMAPLKAANDWLARAAKAGYQPAVFLQADLNLQADLIQGNAAKIEKARAAAIGAASASADPSIVFGMADFVTGARKTRQRAAQLISAWELLGCERGYDCSAQSDVMLTTCNFDPQCQDKPTFVEHLEVINGAAFSNVQQLANEIGAAVDSHDPAPIKKYL